MILRYIGYLISIIFAILGLVFYIKGVYIGHKYYELLPSTNKKTGMKYSFLGILSLSLSLFVFLTVENGFSWDNLGFSASLTIIISIFLYFDNCIRRKTAIFLDKRNALLPSSARKELMKAIDELKKSSASQSAETDEENKE